MVRKNPRILFALKRDKLCYLLSCFCLYNNGYAFKFTTTYFPKKNNLEALIKDNENLRDKKVPLVDRRGFLPPPKKEKEKGFTLKKTNFKFKVRHKE